MGNAHQLFQPLCLTVYLGGRCQLDCCYCYARNDRPQESDFNFQAFQNALAFVAHNCRIHGVPVILVFHGANEPLLYKKNIDFLIEVAQQELSRSNLELFLACTTNGVAPLSVIEWALMAFDHITLSWDGPSKIQDNNRPFKNGKGSSRMLERTADVLKGGKCLVSARATVTRDYCRNLHEIVEYFHQQGIPRVVFSQYIRIVVLFFS
ncbi:MAG: hypothetical protein R2861_03675 [Desulfobacterales bacterium]